METTMQELTVTKQDIVNNLFDFWKIVGQYSKQYAEKEAFKSINLKGSDWPNRVFDINEEFASEAFDELHQLVLNGDVPNLLTIDENSSVKTILESNGYYPLFHQLTMAVDLNSVMADELDPTVYIPIATKLEAAQFARVASGAFGYIVDCEIIEKLISDSRIKMFVSLHEGEASTCGLIFIDDNNHAGLHMVGTLPEYRGQGHGQAMTNNLLQICKQKGFSTCVLQASESGQRIYRNFNFEGYGKITTYTIEGKHTHYRWNKQ